MNSAAYNTAEEPRLASEAAPKPLSAADLDLFWKRIDGYGADPLFPEGRKQTAFEIRNEVA
jgi:hypothetical protein